ncbi:uncharacterized protein LOC116351579 [Contarinia nasturtii]|uniref:uncharacterized protein LOC116351579 n=1 Tax=Contarinia nasturtii TaxID=265458 RepID=UPI0012D3D179|nr:uncharacterized protein LOC116351579 [Contarinia nasturtii]
MEKRLRTRCNENQLEAVNYDTESAEVKIPNENHLNAFSADELMQMVVSMGNLIEVLSKELIAASEQVYLYRTNATLCTSEAKVSSNEEEMLTIFEKYQLPIKTKEEVEMLESDLEKSNDFLQFFIRRIVPIVKNLYQSHKSILEGFFGSLISKEVIVQFRWSGRMENTQAFKELKNVQIVLLSAMIRVDKNYTLYQFENDTKSVLTKCVKVSNNKKKKMVGCDESEKHDIVERSKSESLSSYSQELNENNGKSADENTLTNAKSFSIDFNGNIVEMTEKDTVL